MCKGPDCDPPSISQSTQYAKSITGGSNDVGSAKTQGRNPAPGMSKKLRPMTDKELALFEEHLEVCEKAMSALKVDKEYYRSVTQCGLWLAIQDFDPDGGASLATYAFACIRFEIINYRRNDEFIFGLGKYRRLIAEAKLGESLFPGEVMISTDSLHESGIDITRSGQVIGSDWQTALNRGGTTSKGAPINLTVLFARDGCEVILARGLFQRLPNFRNCRVC